MQVNGNSAQVVFHLFIPTLREFMWKDTYQGALWLLVGDCGGNAVETCGSVRDAMSRYRSGPFRVSARQLRLRDDQVLD